MIEALDASVLDSQDERGCTRVFGARTDGLKETRVIRGNDDGDDERTENVEDYETVDKAL